MAPAETHASSPHGPLSYGVDDQIAVCFDLDGTVYRSSSVFIEAVALLPYYVDCEPDDIEHLHTCIGIVAEYTRGRTARRRIERLLRVVDRVRTTVSPRLSKVLMQLIIALLFRDIPILSRISRVLSPSTRTMDAETISYACMQERVLSTYGEFLEGKHKSAINDAIRALVRREIPIDRSMRSLFDRAASEAGATIYLLTDVPELIARAYMDKLGQPPDHVKATRYPTTASHQFTGDFEPITKHTALKQIRGEDGFDYVIAGGDSQADLAMREIADLFFAIEGRGDIEAALENMDPAQVHTPDRILQGQLDPGYNIVHIKRDERVSEVVEATFEALGIFD